MSNQRSSNLLAGPRRQRARVRRGLALAITVLALAGCGLLQASSPPAFRITYQVQPVDGRTPTADDVGVIRQIVESRLQATGIADLRVTAEGSDRLVVEASPASVLDEVQALAGATGRLDIVPLGSDPIAEGLPIEAARATPLFPPDQVQDATVGVDAGGNRTIDIVLRKAGAQLLADYTAAHVGGYLGIVLDGIVVSAPLISEPIAGGQISIAPAQGGTTLGEAQTLVTILRYGQLPFPIQPVSVERR